MEVEIVRQRRAVIEIEAIGLEVEADRALDRAAFLLAGLGDEVDHRARRVRGEGRVRPPQLTVPIEIVAVLSLRDTAIVVVGNKMS